MGEKPTPLPSFLIPGIYEIAFYVNVFADVIKFRILRLEGILDYTDGP